MTSSLARACVLLTTTAVVGIGAAGVASAHVRADAPGATEGGYAVVTFRVPTESETASTTGVTITLPADAQLASAGAEQLAGWTSSVARSENGSPTAVTFTADAGTGIAADQFGLFSISVGPLPASATLVFDTTQDYSDGTSVQWDEAPNADGSEPEHPAPQISVAASTGSTGDGEAAASTATTTTTAVTASAAPAASASGTSDTTARWLGAGGLLLGALGLGLGGGAALRSRRAGR